MRAIEHGLKVVHHELNWVAMPRINQQVDRILGHQALHRSEQGTFQHTDMLRCESHTLLLIDISSHDLKSKGTFNVQTIIYFYVQRNTLQYVGKSFEIYCVTHIQED